MENEIEIFKNYIFWTEINMELGLSGFFKFEAALIRTLQLAVFNWNSSIKSLQLEVFN